MARPTIRDIARAAGVSPAAVSFALNGRPGVSEETRKRVEMVADSMGWTPNATARALSSSKANAVGLVIPRPHTSYSSERFFFEFIVGLQTTLTESGVDLLLHLADSTSEEMTVQRSWWAQHKVDGIIVVDPRADDERPRALRALGVPTVVVGEAAEGAGAVIGDDAAMIRVIADHLVKAGAHRIGFVHGFAALMHTQRRIRALSHFGTEAGVDVQISAETDYTERAGLAETARLLDSPIAPNALIFDNEILALGGLQAISQRGLKLGRDLIAASCEDSPICRVVSPALTAVGREPATMGTHTAEILLDMLAGHPPRTVTEDVPTLIVRESTADVS